MRDDVVGKALVFGIIILFVGVSVTPSISGNIGRTINVSDFEMINMEEGQSEQILDLAITNYLDDDVSVLLNNGNGGFGNRQDYDVGEGPRDIVAGDFDSDGALDLTITNRNDGDISVLMGDGSGGFGDRTDYDVGEYPKGIVAGDFDSDGDLDLAIGNRYDDDVSVLMGDASGGFGDRTDYDVGDGPQGIVAGDFDSDGALDLAITNFWDDDVSVLLNNGNGGFGNRQDYDVGEGPRDIVAGDFDSDGALDLAIANFHDDDVSILMGDASGGFGDRTDYDVGDGPQGIVAGDFDSDGALDLAITNRNDGDISVLMGDGSGGFGDRQDYNVGAVSMDIVAGDFDSDGALDLAITNFGDDDVSVLLNNGNGGFGDRTDYDVGAMPEGIVAGDFNSVSNQPPTVEITYPEEGDTVSGTITVTGTASDPDGGSDIDYVQVKIDDSGSWETASGTTSWSYDWDTTQYDDGSHTIYARSYDGEYYSEVDSVTVYVNNDGENNPPWFYNEDPEDGETEVSIDLSELTVDIADLEGDSFDWSIETSPNIGSNSGTGYNSTKTCDITGLDYSTTYTWYVNATDPDGSGETTSESYTFTTEEPNHPPVLSTYNGWPDGVDPDSGPPGTEFTFKVHYYDQDGDNPSVKDLRVKPENENWDYYTMHGSGADSDYEYSKKFYTIGTYEYYFYFTDGNGGDDTLPPSEPWWTFEVIPNCAEKPSWDVGDSWNYDVSTFEIDFSSASLSADPFDLSEEVTESTAGQYKLGLEGELTGDASFSVYSGSLDAELDGEITLDKSDLGLKKMEMSLVGELDRPWPLRDIIIDPLTITVEPKDVDVYNFFDFPIYDGEVWTIPTTVFGISMSLRYKFKPGSIWYTVEDEMDFTVYEHDVECVGVENVGDLEAFHVVGLGDYWYSPTKENVVKVDGDIGIASFYAELDYCSPDKPVRPSGKTKVKVGETCEYSTFTVDPNGDRIQYGWDWDGNKKDPEWTLDFYKSNETCIVSHTWTLEELLFGDGQIFVKARDVNGEESVWSDPLSIRMSVDQQLSNSQVSVRTCDCSIVEEPVGNHGGINGGGLSSEDVAALQRQGEKEGWTFTIGENSATKRSLDEMCGLEMPESWWVDATFDPCTPRGEIPDIFDWRDIDGVDYTTPIKSQGSCGSCWAFGTVAPLECNIKIKDGVEEDLSEQWLVSCNQDV